MKLLICGSRNITDFDLTPYVPHECELIISGGARGIDTLAEEYADRHGIPKTVIRPDYKRYGKFAAPLKRNEAMVDMADAVLAVWDGSSGGTEYTMRCAARQNKPLIVITKDK